MSCLLNTALRIEVASVFIIKDGSTSDYQKRYKKGPESCQGNPPDAYRISPGREEARRTPEAVSISAEFRGPFLLEAAPHRTHWVQS
jgi:hypothetical protein